MIRELNVRPSCCSRKQSAHQEFETEPDTKNRTMTILKWTACLNSLRLASSSLRTFFFSNEQRAATTRQGIMRMLTGYKEIPKKAFSCQTTVLDFLKSSVETRALDRWTLETTIQITSLQFKRSASSTEHCHFKVFFILFFTFHKYKYI